MKTWHWIKTKWENFTHFKDYGRLQIQFCITLCILFSNNWRRKNARVTSGNFTFFSFFYLRCFKNMAPGFNLELCHIHAHVCLLSYRKEKTLEVYQQQVTCMMRMKHEVMQLKYTVRILQQCSFLVPFVLFLCHLSPTSV